MKIFLFLFFIPSLALAQHELSVGYSKPNSPDIKSLNGVFINYFYETSSHSSFSIKVGAEFNYQFGNNNVTSKSLGNIYNSNYKIYKYEADIKLSYNKYAIIPFVNGALGKENLTRKVEYSPNIISIYPVYPLDENSIFVKLAFGINLELFKGINIGTSYDFYFLNYKDYGLLTGENALSNNRESINLFMSYNI